MSAQFAPGVWHSRLAILALSDVETVLVSHDGRKEWPEAFEENSRQLFTPRNNLAILS
jgi:hypothetical protein